jgi:hypothetical protein
MPESADQIIRRTETMKGRRHNFDFIWQEIRDFINDTHPAFTSSIEVPGTQTRGSIWSNKAESASEMLATSLHGALTNPGTEWFTLRTQQVNLNELFEVSVWLEDTAKKMRAVFDSPASHFGTALSSAYRDVADFGTMPLYIRDRPGRLPVFSALPLSQVYLAEDQDGQINRVHRWFTMTASQVVEAFKLSRDNVGSEIREAALQPAKAEDPFEIIHAVYPREERLEGLVTATNLPLASDWINVKTREFIRRSGYDEPPIVTPRWDVKAGEVYGRSVGMKALADVKSLQHLMRLTYRGAEKTIDPPLQVADDGLGGPIRTKSSAINYVSTELMLRGRGGILPLQTGANPQLGLDLVEYIGRQIEVAYFTHLLQISRDPRMTATQVIEITEEMLRVLGPFLIRLQNELLGPVIRRVFGILFRAGALLPMPDALRNAPIRVEYLSPVVKAQRLSEVRALSQAEEVTRPMVERDPAVADNLDYDKAFRHVHDRLGVPRNLLKPPKEVAAMRKARQQQDAEQQATEQLAALAPAAQAGAQAVASLGAANQNTPATRAVR